MSSNLCLMFFIWGENCKNNKFPLKAIFLKKKHGRGDIKPLTNDRHSHLKVVLRALGLRNNFSFEKLEIVWRYKMCRRFVKYSKEI